MLCVNGSWVGTYFQVAVSILIFGIGLPSLVMQAIVKHDIRRIVHRNWGVFKWGSVLILVFMAIALAFVWLVHPCATPQPNVIAESLAKYGLVIDSWFASWIITFAIFALGMAWLIQVYHRRDRVLKLLKRKCRRHIAREATPNGVALEDIQYLGEQSETRSEKTQILSIFDELLTQLQDHKRYSSNGLESVISSLEVVLQKEDDVESFIRGIGILRRTVETLRARGFPSAPDVGFVLRALRRLGITALSVDNERPTRHVLDAIVLTSQKPHGVFLSASIAVFELGAAALQQEKFPIATETLSKLEAMTWPRQPLKVSDAIAYLGLIAHFWSRGGSARQVAEHSLEDVEFAPSLEECLGGARQVHWEAARFDTADKLTDMIESRMASQRGFGVRLAQLEEAIQSYYWSALDVLAKNQELCEQTHRHSGRGTTLARYRAGGRARAGHVRSTLNSQFRDQIQHLAQITTTVELDEQEVEILRRCRAWLPDSVP